MIDSRMVDTIGGNARSNRGEIIAQSQAIELVIMESGIRLWDQAVKVVTLATEVNHDLQRNTTITKVPLCRRESLKASKDCVTPVDYGQSWLG